MFKWASTVNVALGTLSLSLVEAAALLVRPDWGS